MKHIIESRREIEFASHPANLCLARDFVRQFLEPLKFTESEKDLMILGLDEACTNVIRHAYHHAPDQLIHLICEHHFAGAIFRLRDFGCQCDPAALNGRPINPEQPGGLGIHLIRKAFDQIDYQRQAEGTELVMSKRFAREDAPSSMS